jgi:hypothetical protein
MMSARGEQGEDGSTLIKVSRLRHTTGSGTMGKDLNHLMQDLL